MRNQFSLLAIIGGGLGIAATAFWTWWRFGSPDDILKFFSDKIIGDIIFTILLLVPFVAIIMANFMLQKQSRWPILLSSSLLSLFWLNASKFSENFLHAPTPTPSGSLFPASFILFLPVTIILIITAGQSLRDGTIWVLPRRNVIILVILSLSSACIVAASLYVLFLNQGSELWSRMLYGGEWVQSPDVRYLPPPAGPGPQQFVNFGVVKPLMASISTGLLVMGILLIVVQLRISGRYTFCPHNQGTQ